MSLLLPLNSFTYCSCVSIVGFEQVNTGWDITLWKRLTVRNRLTED